MLVLKTKKPIYKDLALYLGVSVSAVQQYNLKKRSLMIKGLWLEKELKENEKC